MKLLSVLLIVLSSSVFANDVQKTCEEDAKLVAAATTARVLGFDKIQARKNIDKILAGRNINKTPLVFHPDVFVDLVWSLKLDYKNKEPILLGMLIGEVSATYRMNCIYSNQELSTE